MTRSHTVPVLACLLLAAAAGLSMAVPGPEDKTPRLETVEGVIKAVDPANSTFILGVLTAKNAPADDVKITFDQKTTFWLDGKPSTMDNAMKVGNTASVAHMNKLALKVHVKSKPV